MLFLVGSGQTWQKKISPFSMENKSKSNQRALVWHISRLGLLWFNQNQQAWPCFLVHLWFVLRMMMKFANKNGAILLLFCHVINPNWSGSLTSTSVCEACGVVWDPSYHLPCMARNKKAWRLGIGFSHLWSLRCESPSILTQKWL